MDIEGTVQFILENQARVSAQMGEFSTHLNQLQDLVERIARQQIELNDHVNEFQQEISAGVIAIAEAQKQLVERVDRLAEAQERLTEAQERLTEMQRHTEERLNALITVVDGLIPRRPAQ